MKLADRAVNLCTLKATLEEQARNLEYSLRLEVQDHKKTKEKLAACEGVDDLKRQVSTLEEQVSSSLVRLKDEGQKREEAEKKANDLAERVKSLEKDLERANTKAQESEIARRKAEDEERRATASERNSKESLERFLDQVRDRLDVVDNSFRPARAVPYSAPTDVARIAASELEGRIRSLSRSALRGSLSRVMDAYFKDDHYVDDMIRFLEAGHSLAVTQLERKNPTLDRSALDPNEEYKGEEPSAAEVEASKVALIERLERAVLGEPGTREPTEELPEGDSTGHLVPGPSHDPLMALPSTPGGSYDSGAEEIGGPQT